MKKNGVYHKVYNFFIGSSQIKDKNVKITGQDAKHISSVLRMKEKEKIYISNKETHIKYLAEISSISKDEIDCILLNEVESTESNIKITLFQGLPKSDKMEYIIQKAVELGVYEIVPINMKNCIVKLKDEEKKIKRWQAISEAAAKQSKRNIIPQICRLKNIEDVAKSIKDFDFMIVAYENEDKITLKQILQENRTKFSNKEKKECKIAIVIGPEGGIDEKEAKFLADKSATMVSLGKRILRTETASLAMLSMIMYEYDF